MQEVFTREILPAWRAAREFVGGPEVAGLFESSFFFECLFVYAFKWAHLNLLACPGPDTTAICEARANEVVSTHFMRRGWPGSARVGLPNLLVDTHTHLDHIGQE